MAKAKLGQLVHTKVDPRKNNGDDVAMAFVTKIKEDDDANEVFVNLRVLLDTGADLRVSNVKVLAKRPEEDAEVDSDVSGVQRVAWTQVS